MKRPCKRQRKALLIGGHTHEDVPGFPILSPYFGQSIGWAGVAGWDIINNYSLLGGFGGHHHKIVGTSQSQGVDPTCFDVVRKGDGSLARFGLVQHVFQLRPDVLQLPNAGNGLCAQSLDGTEQRGGPGATIQVPNVRFDCRNLHWLLALAGAKFSRQRACFRNVGEQVGRTMSIHDADVFGRNLHLGQGISNCASNRVLGRCNHGLAVRFRRAVHVMNHGEDVVTIALGIFQPFQQEEDAALTNKEPLALLVEGTGSVLGNSTQCADAAGEFGTQLPIEAAADDHVHITVHELVHGRQKRRYA